MRKIRSVDPLADRSHICLEGPHPFALVLDLGIDLGIAPQARRCCCRWSIASRWSFHAVSSSCSTRARSIFRISGRNRSSTALARRFSSSRRLIAAMSSGVSSPWNRSAYHVGQPAAFALLARRLPGRGIVAVELVDPGLGLGRDRVGLGGEAGGCVRSEGPESRHAAGSADPRRPARHGSGPWPMRPASRDRNACDRRRRGW